MTRAALAGDATHGRVVGDAEGEEGRVVAGDVVSGGIQRLVQYEIRHPDAAEAGRGNTRRRLQPCELQEMKRGCRPDDLRTWQYGAVFQLQGCHMAIRRVQTFRSGTGDDPNACFLNAGAGLLHPQADAALFWVEVADGRGPFRDFMEGDAIVVPRALLLQGTGLLRSAGDDAFESEQKVGVLPQVLKGGSVELLHHRPEHLFRENGAVGREDSLSEMGMRSWDWRQGLQLGEGLVMHRLG